VQCTVQRCGHVFGVAAAAVIGLVLTGFFGLMFLWTAAVFYFQAHLWWQPAVLAVTAAVELVFLGRAILLASMRRPRAVDGLVCVIVVEAVFNLFFAAVLVPVPLL
jgi:hypothetical protein